MTGRYHVRAERVETASSRAVPRRSIEGPEDPLALARALGLQPLECPHRAAPPAVDGAVLRYSPADLPEEVIGALVRHAGRRGAP